MRIQDKWLIMLNYFLVVWFYGRTYFYKEKKNTEKLINGCKIYLGSLVILKFIIYGRRVIFQKFSVTCTSIMIFNNIIKISKFFTVTENISLNFVYDPLLQKKKNKKLVINRWLRMWLCRLSNTGRIINSLPHTIQGKGKEKKKEIDRIGEWASYTLTMRL